MRTRKTNRLVFGLVGCVLVALAYGAEPSRIFMPSKYLHFGRDDGAKTFEELHDKAVTELKLRNVAVATNSYPNSSPTCWIRIDNTNLLVSLTYEVIGTPRQIATVTFKNLKIDEVVVASIGHQKSYGNDIDKK